MSTKETNLKELEACEIIELSITDIDLLAKAFQVITEACNEMQDPKVRLDTPGRVTIN